MEKVDGCLGTLKKISVILHKHKYKPKKNSIKNIYLPTYITWPNYYHTQNNDARPVYNLH